MNIDSILEESKKYIEEPDYIVDMYDLYIIWCSDKLTDLLGRSKEEIMKTNALDLLNISSSDKRKIVADRILHGKGVRELKSIIKDGTELTIKVKFHNFEFEKGHFLVTKILESTPSKETN